MPGRSCKRQQLRHASAAVLALLLGSVYVMAPTDLQAKTPSYARQLGTDIADSVEKVMPSVVVVRTQQTRYHLARDWFFGQVYKIPEELAGQGSGVIISKDGYVLTNNHVVDSADEIQVVLNDETVLPARLIGRHARSDLAVIKIEADKKRSFPFVKAADSDELRVGEFVIAIGSPYSLNSTVTFGIVSQIGRMFQPMPYVDFIQTDAAINQGNSGGPLVDVDGNLVGINTFINTSGPNNTGSIGLGFAIPSNIAMNVAESIIDTGKAAFPWIGVAMNEEDEGLRVVELSPDGPAEKGGLKEGDVILQVNGKDVRSSIDIRRKVMKHRVGELLKVAVKRSGKEKTLNVKLEALPEISQR